MKRQVRALKEELSQTIRKYESEKYKILQLSVLEADLNANVIEKSKDHIHTLER